MHFDARSAYLDTAKKSSAKKGQKTRLSSSIVLISMKSGVYGGMNKGLPLVAPFVGLANY